MNIKIIRIIGLALALRCTYPIYLAAHDSLFPRALSKESIQFAMLPQRDIRLVSEEKTTIPNSRIVETGYWQITNAPTYKNDRLRIYQDMLRDRGVTSQNDLKLFVAQIISENGALSENVDGDHGCSIGIPQRNTCLFRDPLTGRKFNAKTFRERYPVWKSWETQMGWMADVTAGKFHKMKGDVRLTIIAHNSPAAAARGVDTRAGYYHKIVARSATLSLL